MLIVGYLRPKDLETILKKNLSSGRKIYVFIDRCHDENRSLNEEVITLARKYEITHDIKVKVSEVNLGVGRAVPAAVNWIAKNENYFIVLEDDCDINSLTKILQNWTMKFLSSALHHLGTLKVVMKL
jgi:hypothetical protein